MLENPTKLNEDKPFIELTTKTYEYLLFISNNIKSNSLSLPILQTQLSDLQTKNLPFSEQMARIDVIFKANLSQRLYEYMKVYKNNWEDIKSNYAPISQEILEKECAEVLSNRYQKQQSLGNMTQRAARDCGWRYYLCAAAATAGAVACHAACDGTALATTAGLGIPACVALCGTAQAYGLVVCGDSYCP